jgi:ATP-dependent exoDNAse (exonuclease V) beta subunit
VRRRLRERNECELARLLYVAVTRARDRLYVVGSPRRSGPGSLLGVLDLVRASDTPRFDALLPRIDVDAAPIAAPRSEQARRLDTPQRSNYLSGARSFHERDGDSNAAPRRVRASRLAAAVDRQLGLSLPMPNASSSPSTTPAHVDDDDRLPPRPAGRLAHAIVALVATEARDSLSDWPRLRAVVERAAKANGVVDAPAALLDRCAATLHGPLRALVERGASLSFEEALSLDSNGVVVEGNADLIARVSDRTIVVELKLAEARARSSAAQLQVAAYAAALEQRGERAVHVAAWALGDVDPPAPSPFGRTQKSALERALSSLRKM